MPDADDAGRRSTLLDAAASWSGLHGHELVVVFDGAGPLGVGERTWAGSVRVIGSGRADGDSILERVAAECRAARRSWWVVSSDREVRHVAGAGADRCIDSDAFCVELHAGAGAHASPGDGDGGAHDRGPTQQPHRVADGLEPDVRARLERLRRGGS